VSKVKTVSGVVCLPVNQVGGHQTGVLYSAKSEILASVGLSSALAPHPTASAYSRNGQVIC
jgi:hypothetical protein